jgi:hypothetical protein
MILSLGRFGIASADQTHALEKAWAAKRKDSGLDNKPSKRRRV